jgi:CNT family concentrative nucleoside transporter
MSRLIALLGISALVLIAWALSERRREFPWRTALWGVGLQLALGALVFLSPWSRAVFAWCNDAVDALFAASLAGARFLVGPLAAGPGEPGSLGFILAFQALPIAIVVSALAALLYRLRVLQPIVRVFAHLFHRTLAISGAEALSGAANIFVGVESALVVRPYLERMTRSELLVLLTCGMATVASTVLGIYAIMLEPVFHGVAGHLISASIIAIPAAVVIAKVMLPESGEPETRGRIPPDHEEATGSAMGAVITGAMDGLKLIAGIAAGLIALLGLVAIVDLLLAAVCARLGVAHPPTLVSIASIPFYPLAALTGVSSADLGTAAHLLGERILKTEFVSYSDLAKLAHDGAISDPRTVVIVSYALCGFAHIASVAVFVGGTAALVPSRRDDLARLGLKSLIAANLATLMVACVAGVFCSGSEVVLGG